MKIATIVAAALLAVLVESGGPASASHEGSASRGAERSVIGFSADGGYFAFEQFGFNEGTGSPYASLYVLDTRTNRLAVPRISEFIAIDGPTEAEAVAGLVEVRARVRRQSATLLAQLGIPGEGESVARIVATNPITELARSVEFVTAARHPLPERGFRLELVELPSPPPGHCLAGFAEYRMLELTLTEPTGAERVVHRDIEIPEERGCPVRYALSDIVVFTAIDRQVVIVMISRFIVGPEGPDRRFMALAFDLPRS